MGNLRHYLMPELKGRAVALRVFVVMLAVIFAVEFTIMMGFIQSMSFPPFLEAFIDSSMLVATLFPVLYTLIFRPILARTEDALEINEARLREAQRIANLGTWEWRVEDNTLYWSDEMYRIFGMKAQGNVQPYQLFLRPVHPADNEAVRQTMNAAIQENRPYEIEYRIILPNGTVRYVHEQVEMFSDTEGNPQRMVGTVHDISELRSAEHLVRESEARLRSVIDNVPAGVITADASGVIKTMNPAAERMFAMQAADAAGKTLLSLFAESSPPDHIEQLKAGIASQRWQLMERKLLQLDGQRPNGTIFPGEVALSQMQTDADRDVVVIISDITERRKAERQIQQLAHYDFLTGLPNRTLFLDRIKKAVSHADRHKEKFAVLVMDLDGFKEVNDTLGHQMGDVLLQEVAGRLTKCIRDNDTLARIGGDEFVFLLPGVNRYSDAEVVAQTVIKVLQEPFVLAGEAHRIGGSIGISVFAEDADDIDVLIGHADKAMYQAKQAGKNAYRIYQDNEAA